MKNNVISYKNLPYGLPIGKTILTYLLLENLQTKMAHEWYIVLVTLAGVFLAVMWVLSIIGMFTQKSIDIFETK